MPRLRPAPLLLLPLLALAACGLARDLGQIREATGTQEQLLVRLHDSIASGDEDSLLGQSRELRRSIEAVRGSSADAGSLEAVEASLRETRDAVQGLETVLARVADNTDSLVWPNPAGEEPLDGSILASVQRSADDALTLGRRSLVGGALLALIALAALSVARRAPAR